MQESALECRFWEDQIREPVDLPFRLYSLLQLMLHAVHPLNERLAKSQIRSTSEAVTDASFFSCFSRIAVIERPHMIFKAV
jgi:hypothetical protein